MAKQILLINFFIAATISNAFSQNTYTVSNNPGSPSNYKTLQGALDSVPAGSILLLQPSGTSYGYANISKPVIIYGAGYFLGQNPAPYTQANAGETVVTSLSFSKGADGSQVSGLHFAMDGLNSPVNTRILTDSVTNITISRCHIEFYQCCCQGCASFLFIIQNSSNINIKQCDLNVAAALMGPQHSTGITFSNNIITTPYGSPLNFEYNMLEPYQATFDHNSIYAILSSVNFSNLTFTNNVIIQSDTTYTIYQDAMGYADHNVSNRNIFPQGSTNLTTANKDSVFVLYNSPGIGSADGIFQLKPGSVATGYGNDGSDAGAFGTSNHYVLSGIPAIPNIYFASPQQTGTSQGGLKIQLKIKANN